MAKPESNFKNMLITLFVITAIAALALGYVYSSTAGQINAALIKKTNKALELVLPEFEGNPGDAMFKIAPAVSGLDSLECYPAYKDGKLVGLAIKSSTMTGFSGLIRMMIGFKPDGTIHDTFVLEHKETPGLGTGMKEEKFKSQFRGKNPKSANLTVKKDGGEVDALTAATISSRAFCDGLKNAHDLFNKAIKKAKKSI